MFDGWWSHVDSAAGGERAHSLHKLRQSCQSAVLVEALDNLAIALDGALLTQQPYGPVRQGAIQQVQGIGLLRLSCGSSQWQFLGALPGNACLYAPTTANGSGALWGYGGGSPLGMPFSGTLGQTSYGSGVFVANYQP